MMETVFQLPGKFILSFSLRFLEPVVRISVHRIKAHPGLNPGPCPLADLRTLSCLWVSDLVKILFNNYAFYFFAQFIYGSKFHSKMVGSNSLSILHSFNEI